ncbi:porin [Hyalangium versicolor]|uniref:porin n=1 Tax=Hyalangium versicolor TaxID=2861190 RepID=UPI001CCD2C42|nr:porin [Hyalangium versicolor]
MHRFALVFALATGPWQLPEAHAASLDVQAQEEAPVEPKGPVEAPSSPEAGSSLETLLSRGLGLRPTVLTEIDYRVFPSVLEGNSGFALAHFRPGVLLAPTDWFRAVGTVEFAGEYASILDAFMALRATPWAEFSIGYSKPPLFPSFIYEADASLPFPDRAPVITSFQIRRDLGADVHFTPRSIPLEGWLRVGNGTGSALGNDNALPAGYASIELVLGRAWVGAAAEQRTFGLRLGSSGFIESAGDRDGITGQTPLGFLYYRPIVVSGLRGVVAGHAIAYAGPLRLTVEGATARESRSRDDDGNPATPRIDLPTVRSHGLTAEVAWVLQGRPRQVGVAPRGIARQDGAWGGGAVELAARYDGLWLGHGARDVRAGGSQGGALALKWWPTDFLTAALAGYVTHYDFGPVEEPDRLWSWGVIARTSFFWGNSAR